MSDLKKPRHISTLPVPGKARERLGMSPNQHNLLIRVTLRSLDGGISKADANRVYDLIYRELHEGRAGYFRTEEAHKARAC